MNYLFFNKLIICSANSVPILSCASNVAAPICGVNESLPFIKICIAGEGSFSKVSMAANDNLLDCINGFGNVDSHYSNEDSYYSMFFDNNASNITKEDNRIRNDWYEFVKEKDLLTI